MVAGVVARKKAPSEDSSPFLGLPYKGFRGQVNCPGQTKGARVPDSSHVIFVVDDEPVISQTLAAILNRAGFEAHAFDHPEKALAARAQMAPDLLISDVMMPEMTGVELAILFRKAQPECKILLFSGQAATADLLQNTREQGYDFDLLAKPVHPADLLAKLRK